MDVCIPRAALYGCTNGLKATAALVCRDWLDDDLFRRLVQLSVNTLHKCMY